MKKFAAFSLVTTLLLTGCNNQSTVSPDTMLIPSQISSSVKESENESSVPEEKDTEPATETPSDESSYRLMAIQSILTRIFAITGANKAIPV